MTNAELPNEPKGRNNKNYLRQLLVRVVVFSLPGLSGTKMKKKLGGEKRECGIPGETYSFGSFWDV